MTDPSITATARIIGGIDMITTRLVKFQDLTNDELYNIFAIRSEVFVVEQRSIYQDLDFKDQNAIHILIRDKNTLAGYARILAFDDEHMSFGRLLTSPSYRKQGLGKNLMTTILDYLTTHHPSKPIKIKAQCYLQDFYQQHGFETQGSPFEEDGILHILMVKHHGL